MRRRAATAPHHAEAKGRVADGELFYCSPTMYPHHIRIRRRKQIHRPRLVERQAVFRWEQTRQLRLRAVPILRHVLPVGPREHLVVAEPE